MSVTVIIGIAAAFFIFGILFIIKGIAGQDEDAVPISNPEEIQALKNSFMPSENALSEESGSESEGSVNNQEECLTQSSNLLEQEIDALKKENQRMRDAMAEKIRNYEDKISTIQEANAKLTPNMTIIEELKQKGELFEQWHEESKARQQELERSIASLEAEKDELLRSQMTGIDSAELDAVNSRLQSSITAIETLKNENQELQQFNQDLKNDVELAKSRNAQLIEKEKIMEYELSKNRAQTLGLEKLCEGFKTQIEHLTAVPMED